MEVLTTTTTGRPRFIPTEPVVMSSSPSVAAATATMTRSSISHNNHQHYNGTQNGQSPPPTAADTSIRDKTKLLQLAEKVHTRKSASPNYTKSFRVLSSVVSKSAKDDLSPSTPTVRRTNSTMFSSSSASAPHPPSSRSKLENYKNPKLYASFSSKSSSKLTKALIKSDPAKTNIEHLVNYKNTAISSPKGHNDSPCVVNGKRISENGESTNYQSHNNNGNSGGGGLSSFITPLKALHASFHERSSKLGQTRSRLFSNHHTKEISASNAKLLFGTTENLNSSCSSGSSSSEDILSTEIIVSKRNQKLSSQDPQKNKLRRALGGNNNLKNVTPSPLSSANSIREQLHINGDSGHVGGGTTTNATVRPDFLDGFRNENSCSSSSSSADNVGYNNAKDNGTHVTTNYLSHHHRDLNGSERVRENHEQEISRTNATNSFITPDILGGCIDAPKGFSNTAPHLISSSANNVTRQKGISENNQNGTAPTKAIEEPRHVNDYGKTNGDGNSRGLPDGSETQRMYDKVQMAQDRNIMLQKRKNIVVRMSYQNGDDTNYNALYGGSNGGENLSDKRCDDQVDIWPISPITVSTVTPKAKSLTSNKIASLKSDNVGEIRRATTNSNNCGKDEFYNRSGSTSGDNPDYIVHAQDRYPISNSPYAAFNPTKNSFTPNNGHCKPTTGGDFHQQQFQNNNRSQGLSTVPNSGISFERNSAWEGNLIHTQQQIIHQDRGVSTGQDAFAYRSSQQPQEKADQLFGNKNDNVNTIQSHSPEAAGSPAWLQTTNSSLVKNDAQENGIIGSSYLNGEYKKSTLKKAASSPSGGGSDETGRTTTRSSAHNTNGSSNGITESLPQSKNINDRQNEEEYFASKENSYATKSTGETAKEKSGNGMFMEAETSFVAHQKLSRSSASGRPQTALLSDEYACYLGYEGNKDEMQVQQTRPRLQRLGNEASLSSSSSRKENCENDGDIFGSVEEQKKLMMLAITTTTGQGRYKEKSSHGGKMNVTSIMKGKRQDARQIMHSVSFRGMIDSTEVPKSRENYKKCFNGLVEEDEKEESESINEKFDRKRSRSLPKSFMSMRNGLRHVLPSQWARDGLVFDRLNDCENACPTEETLTPAIDEEEEDSSAEPLKMRWNKLGSTPSTSASFSSDRRPKSFDYAQRKAWMKLYRDMEVSQAGSSSSGPRVSRPISKGSITHLHLQDQSSSTDHLASCGNLDETGDCRCDYESDGASMSTMMRSSADISETSPSLFKRFSKTFSLRFGSGSNVSKQAGDVHRKSKSKGAIGSSPDLYRVDADGSRDKVNGKMRKTNVKSVRGDKCQSGDSGIGIEDQQTEARHVSNLRRIRSDYISSSTLSASQVAAAHASRQHANTSALAKLSLVEIPDHSWDENNGSPNEGSGTSNTASYEDLVDAKLDGDDGFSSSDEGQHLEHVENPTYYHTLPHRKHNKRRLKETDSANSCGGEVPQEDNSIRGKVVREIIHTEQNYVKTLNDIVQGFLNPCRARNDLFSSRTVQNIFSNIEDILRLHVKFLEALKSKLDPTYVSKSNVGGVFTTWADKFSLYSEYCCNNPISVATVRSLVQFPQYAEFFEACRRLQMMDKLPLHGFLLRPIQRICQYHLQLNELLKHTEESHTDHQSVVEALETMKSVANKINDTQRQFESLQELIRFQNSIDGWEGPNLVDRNSVILRKGELVKVTHGRKHKEVFVAILNKDLIYCKKDFMKKSGYVFDGRIDLNLRMWINIDSNEEDEFFGMVHNSWRIYSPERRAWILFTAPSPTEKRKWISALEKTKEEVVVDPKLREMAVVTTALADSEMMGGVGYQGHHSNTLPKSSKKSKSKNPLSVTKVDSDAMLIEVGKLKRSTVYPNANNIPSGREGTSKFYV